MIVEPKSGKPTRVGRKIDEKGKKVRYYKKSGEVIA
jgi:large subunit ribosomal protein L24